jgi:hypothetical protein
MHANLSLDAKVLNYFIFHVILEELLDATMWLKLSKGYTAGYSK